MLGVLNENICLDTSVVLSALEPDWRGTVTLLRLNDLLKSKEYSVVTCDIVLEELRYSKFGKKSLEICKKYISKVYETDENVVELYQEYRKEIRSRRGLGIPRGDAVILAIGSINDLDYILSWNFEHLLNSDINSVVEEVNEKRKLKTPLIYNPKVFVP